MMSRISAVLVAAPLRVLELMFFSLPVACLCAIRLISLTRSGCEMCAQGDGGPLSLHAGAGTCCCHIWGVEGGCWWRSYPAARVVHGGGRGASSGSLLLVCCVRRPVSKLGELQEALTAVNARDFRGKCCHDYDRRGGCGCDGCLARVVIPACRGLGTCGQLQTQQQYTTHSTMKAVRTHEPGGVASTPAHIEPHHRRRMCPAHAAGAAGSAEPPRGLPPRLPPLLALRV
eukprot:COSAG01_NODE_1082_length_11813_cov_23.531757_1_plen_229_part_10